VKPELNPTVVGISMNGGLNRDGKGTCGALSKAKERFSRFWSSPTRQGRGVADTASAAGLRSDGYSHRQTEILRSGASRNWLLGFA
jgi:hypothetical protein